MHLQVKGREGPFSGQVKVCGGDKQKAPAELPRAAFRKREGGTNIHLDID